MNLPDILVRDPFETAQELRPPKSSDLGRALASLFPGTPRRVLITNRASETNHVIGATVGGTCDLCNAPVWHSPSTKRASFNATVCLTCLEMKAAIL